MINKTKALKTINHLKISTLVVIILSLLPWADWFNFEARSEFFSSVFSYRLTTNLISFLLILFFVRTIWNWKSWESFIYLIPIISIFYLNLLFGMFAFPTIWDDEYLYSKNNSSKVLIIQKFSFGIAGNGVPRFRCVITKKESLHNNIRFIRITDNSIIPILLRENSWLILKDSLPQNIIYQKDTFNLNR